MTTLAFVEAFTSWLRQQMSRRGLRPGQVAAMAGVTPSTVSKWLAGNTVPDPESCGRLAVLFGRPVAEVYVAAGHPSPEYVPEPRDLVTLHDRAQELLAELPVEVPVYDQLVSAGEGHAATIDRIYLPPARGRGRRLFGLPVRGTSMAPGILEGDTVVIDPDAAPRDGDTVVASVGDEVVVKTLRRKSDHFVLQGTNGKVIPADEARIAGVVVQIIRNVPRG